ncbi:FAD-dependent monooxygenase [Streptomyces sp. NPDC051172]|uniref:FAD-dependent monooxygenase n=1 Tax=Streptomyces sp. NPDC051172 TaxID=3155796 RepID=UPI003441CCC3
MDASVIVVGAGPSGLMLAGELRLAGSSVIVLERLAQPSGESRGLGFTARTMEVFDQRGLLPRFGEIETGTMGHFGGLPLDLGCLDGRHEAAKVVQQSVTERVLESWATELGADIRRRHEFLELDDLTDSVVVRVRGPEGEHVLRASYLVGCDGGRGRVRKAAGFDFPGSEATAELLLADIRGVEVPRRVAGSSVRGGMAMSAPMGGGVSRVILSERGAPLRSRTRRPEFSEVADAWKRLTGVDISDGEPVWVSAFTDAARQVTQYRRGRVLLAGDAAHIHLPAGGQGMNTSIQDSVNLGWKLAAVVRGTAPEHLLDTYHEERHPVGRRLLTNARAQGLLILGGDDMQPLRDVLSELMDHEEVRRHLAAMVSGLEIRYDMGGGSHPLLGLRMPHLDLTVGTRGTGSTELLRPGRGVLLDLTGNDHLRRRAGGWAARIDIVTADASALPDNSPLAGTSALLLRPDGHICWTAPGSHTDLRSALARWFGPPAAGMPGPTRPS